MTARMTTRMKIWDQEAAPDAAHGDDGSYDHSDNDSDIDSDNDSDNDSRNYSGAHRDAVLEGLAAAVGAGGVDPDAALALGEGRAVHPAGEKGTGRGG